jgi:hypothetical protein
MYSLAVVSALDTLYGKFPSGTETPALEEIMGRGSQLATCHCLMLDRRDRRAYIPQRDQTMMLFAIVEPEECDYHNVFVDGLLMSPGSENYKFAPRSRAPNRVSPVLGCQVTIEQGA